MQPAMVLLSAPVVLCPTRRRITPLYCNNSMLQVYDLIL